MDKTMNHYKAVWENWSDFSGRVALAPFWYAVLLHFIIVVVLALLSRLGLLGGFVSIIGMLYGLAAIIPFLALSVRRLHDTGKSGYWALLYLIPIIGWIILIIFFIQPSIRTGSHASA